MIQCPSWATCSRYQSILLKSEKTTSLGVLHYSEYSKCSEKCGPGFRNRSVSCKSIVDNSIELPLKFCDSSRIERLTIDCQLAVCNYKLMESWGKVILNLNVILFFKKFQKNSVFSKMWSSRNRKTRKKML